MAVKRAGRGLESIFGLVWHPRLVERAIAPRRAHVVCFILVAYHGAVVDWLASVKKLTKFVADYTVSDWRVEEHCGSVSIWNGDRQECGYIHPQLASYLISGILLGYGYKLEEDKETQLCERVKDLN